MAHWRKGHQSASNNLTSADLFDETASAERGMSVYRSAAVKVEKVSVGKVQSREKPKGESRNFLHFVGKSKPLGMNVTNCETMTSLSGSPDTARWVGLTIQIYVDPHAKYPTGKTGPAIRIRPTLPTAAADTAPLPAVSADTRERLENEHEERLRETREPGEEN